MKYLSIFVFLIFWDLNEWAFTSCDFIVIIEFKGDNLNLIDSHSFFCTSLMLCTVQKSFGQCVWLKKSSNKIIFLKNLVGDDVHISNTNFWSTPKSDCLKWWRGEPFIFLLNDNLNKTKRHQITQMSQSHFPKRDIIKIRVTEKTNILQTFEAATNPWNMCRVQPLLPWWPSKVTMVRFKDLFIYGTKNFGLSAQHSYLS